MKVTINSLSNKKVSYKIYDYNGGRRKLLRKGRFLHSVETEITPKNSEIIVRVSRNVSPLSFLYVWFMVVIEALSDLFIRYHRLNYLWEIKISKLNEGDDVNVVYTNAVPETGREYDPDRQIGVPDALYCTSHPCKKIVPFIRRQSWLSHFIAIIVLIIIIVLVIDICKLIIGSV